jgi:hypothetical protein
MLINIILFFKAIISINYVEPLCPCVDHIMTIMKLKAEAYTSRQTSSPGVYNYQLLN